MAKISNGDIRRVRHSVAILKRKGLISPSVDARSVQPSKTILSQIRKFSDVLTGESGVISAKRIARLSKAELEVMGARRARPKGGSERIVVKKNEPGEKITSTRKQITLRSEFHDIIRLPNQIDEFKISDLDARLIPKPQKDEYFSFKLFGHRSSREFRTPGLMMQFLRKYDAIKSSPEDSIKHLQIYRYKRGTDFYRAVPDTGRKPKRGKPQSSAKRSEARAKLPEWKKEINREKDAERKRLKRAAIKADGGAEYEKEKAASRKRAAKSRKNK